MFVKELITKLLDCDMEAVVRVGNINSQKYEQALEDDADTAGTDVSDIGTDYDGIVFFEFDGEEDSDTE